MSKNYIYIDKLAYDFGVHDLPTPEKENILSELNTAFEDRLLAAIADKLTSNQQEELLVIANNEESNREDVFNYLIENIDNLNQVMDQVYLDLRKELLSDIDIIN